MSRYWVFQNNQVVGPHDVEDLSSLPGYGPDSLVCPEGRKGTNMGDWQRASMVAELAMSLTKASQLTTAGKGSGSVYGSLPPEPTLKDLAALGSLQEKVSFLDSTVTQLQDNLRLKETEILSLHKELEDKTSQAQELAVKLGSLEERLSSVGSLQQNLDRAVAAEQDVESTVQKQAQVIDNLAKEIDNLKGEQKEIEKLKYDLDQLRKAPGQAPASFAPAPMAKPAMEPPRVDAPPAEPAAASAPAFSLQSPEPLQPLDSPKLGASSEKTDFLFKPEPLANPDATAKLEPLASAPGGDLLGAPGIEIGAGVAAPAQGLSASPFGTAAMAPPPVAAVAPPPAGELAATSKKKGGKGLLFAVVALVAGAGAAFKLGLIPLSRKAPEPPPAPVEPATPPPPTAEQQAEAARQAAIDLVKRFPTPKGMTIGDALETGLKIGGGLSPWMADKIDDASYQVNFFSSKPMGGNGQNYQFSAGMADGKVAGLNPVAKALLAVAPPPAPARKRARKAAVKRRARRVPKADAASLDDLLKDGDQQPKKDESLDQMLLPGASDNAGGDQPAAAPAPAPAADSSSSDAQPAPKADDDANANPSTGKNSDSDLLDTMLKP